MESHKENKTILITGISGYTGSNILKYFLQESLFDSYTIRGTVRKMEKLEKIRGLINEIGEEKFNRV
jgi:nucleoside-diphosphate-sugar epimerase